MKILAREYTNSIKHLFCSLQYLQEYQNKLTYLVPEKQLLTERIKNVQLDSTQSKCLQMNSLWFTLLGFCHFTSYCLKKISCRI